MKTVRNTSQATSIAAVILSALAVSACSHGESASAAAAPAAAPSAAAAAAPASAPAAAPAATAPASAPEPSPAPAAPAPSDAAAPAPVAAAPAPPTAVDRETARKNAQIEWALKQDEIRNDPKGQWATQATASSTMNDAKGKASYSAHQATGVPDVQVYSTSPLAWASKTADSGIEWIELTFAKPVFATGVRIRENSGPGAVIRVEAFDEKGAPTVVWSGADGTKDLNYLIAEFPKTAFKTKRVKLTLATNVVQGWNQIDAVQLVGTEQ
jgi:hypothetical protein